MLEDKAQTLGIDGEDLRSVERRALFSDRLNHCESIMGFYWIILYVLLYIYVYICQYNIMA